MTKKLQAFVRVVDNNFDVIQQKFNDGWSIVQMTSCAAAYGYDHVGNGNTEYRHIYGRQKDVQEIHSYCYILFEKEIEITKPIVKKEEEKSTDTTDVLTNNLK